MSVDRVYFGRQHDLPPWEAEIRSLNMMNGQIVTFEAHVEAHW